MLRESGVVQDSGFGHPPALGCLWIPWGHFLFTPEAVATPHQRSWVIWRSSPAGTTDATREMVQYHGLDCYVFGRRPTENFGSLD